jgi:beclin 1
MTACQRCSQPLRLDASLSQGLGQSAFDMIASSLPEASTSYAPSATSASPLSRLPSALQSAYTNRSGPAASRKVVAAPPGRVQPSLAAARPSWPNGPPAESYVLLSDSQVRPPAASVAGKGKQAEGEGQEDYGPRSLSKDLARTHALFDLVSAHSDIDHPLCTECGAVLAALMDRQLADAKRERERYLAYERDLAGALSSTAGKGKGNADVERGRMEKEIRRLEAEEAQAIEDLKAAERERVKLDEELAALELEESALAAEEEQCVDDLGAECRAGSSTDSGSSTPRIRRRGIDWSTRREACRRAMSEISGSSSACSGPMCSVRPISSALMSSMTRLPDDAFHIVINDSSASINGLRFGKTSKAPLEWPEFNAAWGHILLLLATLARRLGHDFNGCAVARCRFDCRHKASAQLSPGAHGLFLSHRESR